MEAASGWKVRFCMGPGWDVFARSTLPADLNRSMFVRLEDSEKSVRVVSRWLRDNQASELPTGPRTTSEPCPNGQVGSVAGGCHQEPARGGSPAATQVEGLRAGLAKQDVRLRRIHPDDEVLSVNPDSHVAAEEKGDAAEHLLLDEPWSTCERLPDPRGLRLRIRHRSREVLSAHETWRRLATQFAIAGIFRKNP